MNHRTKEIKIRVTEQEYSEMLQRKTCNHLAKWLRELALEQPKRKPPKKTDPELLQALNKIGVNLNQIARACNIARNDRTVEINLLNVANALYKIEQDFNEVLKNDR